MPTRTAIVFALLLIAATSGAQSSTATRPSRELLGCYAVAIGEWMLLSGHWLPDSVVPRVVTLDTAPVTGGGWRLTPEVVDSRNARRPATARWRMRKDTLELIWPNASRPTHVRLGRRAAGVLSGYAVAERDTAQRRRAVAGVEARRIACETDPPPRFATPDTARLVDGRLVIEPLGVSFRLPPVWLGVPRVTNKRWRTCGDDPAGSLEDRVRTNRRMLPEVTHANGEWQREFSAVADSIGPFDALVAQAGSGLWGVRATCFAVVHMRVYVGTFTPEWLMTRVATAGARTARRFFQPVEQEAIDTAGWRGTRLKWQAWYYDYGGTALVDVFARRVRHRTLALVFMYVGPREEQLAERALVLESFQMLP